MFHHSEYQLIKNQKTTGPVTFEIAYKAAEKGKVETVREFLKTNPQLINWINSSTHYSLLHVAAKSGRVNVVDCLIEHKANLNLRSTEKIYCGYYAQVAPLHVASYHGHFEVVERLLRAGATVNICDSDVLRRTPLIYAIDHEGPGLKVVTLVRLLLDNGADPRIVGQTVDYNLLNYVGKKNKKILWELIDAKFRSLQQESKIIPPAANNSDLKDARIAELARTIEELREEIRQLKADRDHKSPQKDYDSALTSPRP